MAALAVMGGYWGLILRFFTLAVALLPLTNFWVPALPAVFLIYPGLEQNFHIEETLREREASAHRARQSQKEN